MVDKTLLESVGRDHWHAFRTACRKYDEIRERCCPLEGKLHCFSCSLLLSVYQQQNEERADAVHS